MGFTMIPFRGESREKRDVTKNMCSRAAKLINARRHIRMAPHGHATIEFTCEAGGHLDRAENPSTVYLDFDLHDKQ